ncbi:MAG: hypothetical protein ACREHF_11555 [Rhizomicrobium sp.]
MHRPLCQNRARDSKAVFCVSEEHPWFRRRTSGYGWTPASWQGGLITIAGAAVVLAIDIAIIIRLWG